MTPSTPSPGPLSSREIGFHLLGLALFIALLALWFWFSTGARAVPRLIALLKEADASSRIIAAEQLGHIGSPAVAASPALIEQATNDPSQHANTTAAAALKSIDLLAARQVMDHYLALLKDRNVQLQRTACAVLGSLGPVAKPAVPALVDLAKDPDELVRRNALTALAGIGLPSAIVTEALIAGLHDSESFVRHAAVAQFAFGYPLAPEADAALRALASDPDGTIAALAKTALERHIRNGPSEVQALTMLVREPMRRDYALFQLARLGPTAGAAVPAILGILHDERPLHRYLAAEALAAIGLGGTEVLSALQQARNDPDPIVEQSVEEAIGLLSERGRKGSP
jgi:HEAT repeat protein